jgi:hypothetical protein
MKSLLAAILIICAGAGLFGMELNTFEDTPGTHWYVIEKHDFTVLKNATYDCLTPETALKLTFLEADPSNCVYTETIKETLKIKFAGFAFWVKGDGSDNTGIVGLNAQWGGTNFKMLNMTKNACIAEFPLKDKTWKRYAFKWEDLKSEGDGILPQASIQQLFFSVKAPAKCPVSYIVDKIDVLKKLEETADDKELAKAAAEKKEIKPDAPPIKPADYVSGKGNLETEIGRAHV